MLDNLKQTIMKKQNGQKLPGKSTKQLAKNPPVQKPATPQETFTSVITAIRQHEPEDQNEIVNEVIKELAIDRENRFNITREEYNRATKNIDQFVAGKEVAAVALKERANTQNQKANR
jgi:hypothetical protein